MSEVLRRKRVIRREPRRGPRWWRESQEDLYQLSNENRVQAGLGVDYNQSPNGAMLTAWPLGGGPPVVALRSFYDFQMYPFITGSPANTHVLIYDGVVYGPNNDSGVDPAGMPSNNTYVIDGVQNDDEIWLGITYDVATNVINTGSGGVWIAWGAATPDDTPGTNYITLGHVKVTMSGGHYTGIKAFNEVCGDVDWSPNVPDESQCYVWGFDKRDTNYKWLVVCPGTCST